MAGTDEITLDQVKARLKKIKAKYPTQPPRDPIYEYLEPLYRLHRKFGQPEKGHPIRDYLDSEYERLGHGRIQYSYFRVMVDLTVPPGTRNQKKTRIANALEYVFKRKKLSQHAVQFMIDEGGYKKCDELYRQQNKKKKL